MRDGVLENKVHDSGLNPCLPHAQALDMHAHIDNVHAPSLTCTSNNSEMNVWYALRSSKSSLAT